MPGSVMNAITRRSPPHSQRKLTSIQRLVAELARRAAALNARHEDEQLTYEELGDLRREARAAALESAHGVLTAAQRAALERLKGAPVRFTREDLAMQVTPSASRRAGATPPSPAPPVPTVDEAD